MEFTPLLAWMQRQSFYDTAAVMWSGCVQAVPVCTVSLADTVDPMNTASLPTRILHDWSALVGICLQVCKIKFDLFSGKFDFLLR